MVEFLTSCCMQSRSAPVMPHMAALLPMVHLIGAHADLSDQELSNTASCLSVLLAHAPLQPQHVHAQLAQLSQLAGHNSWRMRGGLIPQLQCFVYKHQYVLAENSVADMAALLQRLLQDPQLECRDAAVHLLSGFVR